VPVTVAVVSQKDVPVEIQVIGNVEAYSTISVKAQVGGQLTNVYFHEGDYVKTGDLLFTIDPRPFEAALNQAIANLAQQKAQVLFAQQELDRARALVPKGFETQETLDQRAQQMNGALQAQNAAVARIGEATHALDAATHDVELYQVDIADNTLVAPKDGPIEYRVANVGEVLAAGGKVFTMLDSSYVYMDIYLPTVEAGRAKPGADSRIVLDAYPDHPIPAAVVFVASQAQFTPKTVETKDERDTLMFRVRVRIDPERLRSRAVSVRSGLPGMAYVRTDPAVGWPANLQGDAAK